MASYDLPKLERMRKAWERVAEPSRSARLALTNLRQAEQELAGTDWDYARELVAMAIAAIPIRPHCNMTAEMLWLASAHCQYETEEVASALGISESSVTKRIAAMHGHFRDAAGSDIECTCGHPFGRQIWPCHQW